MAFLKVFEGGEERTAFLGDSSLVVGRGEDADIFIRDLKASRRHCVVEPGGATGWRVRDLQSGTLLAPDANSHSQTGPGSCKLDAAGRNAPRRRCKPQLPKVGIAIGQGAQDVPLP